MPAGQAAGSDGDSPSIAAVEPKYAPVEATNIRRLFGKLARTQLAGLPTLNAETLCDYHHALMAGLPVQADKPVGRFRSGWAMVGGKRCTPAAEAPGMVRALLDWASSPANDPLPSAPLASGVIRAAAAHAQLLVIHPFADGNGRVARAAEFHVLLAAGLPLTLAHELHNWHNQQRPRYNRNLQAAWTAGPEPFVAYALEGLSRRIDWRVEQAMKAAPFVRRQLLKAGFTLTELVIVILILGILAGVAAPRFLDASEDARVSAEKELVRRIRAGIDLYRVEQFQQTGTASYPAELDDAETTTTKSGGIFFDEVLGRGVRGDEWIKVNTLEYQSPTGASYVYDPATGEFAAED